MLAAPPRHADGAQTLARARLGITASRRVGGAVVRNRVKRRVREWFRTTRPCAGDWVVIARSGAVELSARETARELDRLAAEAAP